MKAENEISGIVLNAAFEVHTILGPGLLENTYEFCLIHELTKSNLKVERQKGLPLVYKDIKLELGYRVDLIIENRVIVELKATDGINDLFIAQTLTYMRLSGCRLGLLLNFNVPSLKNGIKRLIL